MTVLDLGRPVAAHSERDPVIAHEPGDLGREDGPVAHQHDPHALRLEGRVQLDQHSDLPDQLEFEQRLPAEEPELDYFIGRSVRVREVDDPGRGGG